jgi:hypothetical protein
LRILVVEAALGADGSAHGSKHMTAIGTAHVDGEARLDAGFHQTSGRRPAVPHLQLDVGRNGGGDAGIGHHLQLVIRQ